MVTSIPLTHLLHKLAVSYTPKLLPAQSLHSIVSSWNKKPRWCNVRLFTVLAGVFRWSPHLNHIILLA